jgi:hypothetical protein
MQDEKYKSWRDEAWTLWNVLCVWLINSVAQRKVGANVECCPEQSESV